MSCSICGASDGIYFTPVYRSVLPVILCRECLKRWLNEANDPEASGRISTSDR